MGVLYSQAQAIPDRGVRNVSRWTPLYALYHPSGFAFAGVLPSIKSTLHTEHTDTESANKSPCVCAMHAIRTSQTDHTEWGIATVDPNCCTYEHYRIAARRRAVDEGATR